jgi:hypothetical protein
LKGFFMITLVVPSLTVRPSKKAIGLAEEAGAAAAGTASVKVAAART